MNVSNTIARLSLVERVGGRLVVTGIEADGFALTAALKHVGDVLVPEGQKIAHNSSDTGAVLAGISARDGVALRREALTSVVQPNHQLSDPAIRELLDLGEGEFVLSGAFHDGWPIGVNSSWGDTPEGVHDAVRALRTASSEWWPIPTELR